ncbi:hypothetical protein CLU79DRAFT_780367, partial [Phycomyces nitens]
MASVGGSLFPLLVALLVLLVEVVDCITPCTVSPVYIKKKIRLSNSIIRGNQNKEYNLFIPQSVYEQGSTRYPRNASQSQPMINILSQGNVKTL